MQKSIYLHLSLILEILLFCCKNLPCNIDTPLELTVFLWQVRGKYGYYDPEGVLRKASYGATSEGGFEPQIAGLVLPARPAVDPRQN